MERSFSNSVQRLLNPINIKIQNSRSLSRNPKTTAYSQLQIQASASSSSSKRSKSKRVKEVPEERKKNERKRERRQHSLISISPTGERWDTKWDCDYLLTLRELGLGYLAVEQDEEAEVQVTLTIQQHAGIGLSIRGRIITSFNRECSWCSKSFHKEIDKTFDATVLPEPRYSDSGLEEIGGDDSVIYVRYGSEADLDPFVQDTILVAALSQDTCTESCGDTPFVAYSDEEDNEPRWPQLLRLKQELLEQEAQSNRSIKSENSSDANSK